MLPDRRSRKTGPIPFLNDPFRGPPLSLTKDVISPLSGNHYLSTALVDYLIQRSMPSHLPDSVLIGSSNAFTVLKTMNETTKYANPEKVRKLREKYKYYSSNGFKFISAICNKNHFFVVKVDFDVRRDNIFQDVRVFDSLRRTRLNIDAVDTNSNGGKLLRELQLFLSQFAFFDVPMNETLVKNPDLILAEAVYSSCPQQQNAIDCGLFAYATLLHLVWDENIGNDTFTQQHISSLRSDLYTVLTTKKVHRLDFPDPKKHLSCKFLFSFFPLLGNKVIDGENNVDDCYITMLSAKSIGGHKSTLASFDSAKDVDSSEDGNSGSDYIEVIDPNNQQKSASAEDEAMVAPNPDEERVLDMIFHGMFVEENFNFKDMKELDLAVDRYELMSGY
jgi:hypothetical protein